MKQTELINGTSAAKAAAGAGQRHPDAGQPRQLAGGQGNPVFGASRYTWQLRNGAPNASVITAQTTAARTTLTSLTPGAACTVTLNAIGAAGPGDWSNAASQMAV